MLKNITVHDYLRRYNMELVKGMLLYSAYHIEHSINFKFIEFFNKDLIRIKEIKTGKITIYHIYN